jgi:ADP-ribose pyrophosphatase YjhB (NUDIX family)
MQAASAPLWHADSNRLSNRALGVARPTMIEGTASPTEPQWLLWAREMQAMAQTGLAFTRDQYDRERYQRLRSLAAEIMAEHADMAIPDIEMLFTQQSGYATPKLGVRGAVFQDDRLLLVRETVDDHRWTLPGGWADVNESPAEAVAREVREEAGIEVRPYKLAAVWDRARHPHGVVPPFHVWRLFFLCEIIGGELRTGPETSEVAFFAEHELPTELSTRRVLLPQLKRMFEHMRLPELPTEFD